MGKILIIKDADFSQVAIEQVTPIEPEEEINLFRNTTFKYGFYTSSGGKWYGEDTQPLYKNYPNENWISEQPAIPIDNFSKLKLIIPNETLESVARLCFMNDNAGTQGSLVNTETISTDIWYNIPSNTTKIALNFRIGDWQEHSIIITTPEQVYSAILYAE